MHVDLNVIDNGIMRYITVDKSVMITDTTWDKSADIINFSLHQLLETISLTAIHQIFIIQSFFLYFICYSLLILV